MKGLRWGMKGWGWKAVAVLAIATLPIAAARVSRAQEGDMTHSRRLTRELSIMEKVIDQMLLDSRNFLVYSGDDNTRGLYLEEFGVLFSFQASLVNRGKKEDWEDFDWDKFKIEQKDGVIVISPPDDKGGDKDKDKDKNNDNDKDKNNDNDNDNDTDNDSKDRGINIFRNWRQRNNDVQARLYAEGKEEIVDLLLDYGDSMTSLRDNQWLAIAAFLKRTDFFLDQRISRAVIKAKMSDLRLYADHKITRDEMKKRVVEEEY